tara:strand:+ start:896 stop:1735 length:840 start_codon:yes stop_codon:yes gene_type:complete
MKLIVGTGNFNKEYILSKNNIKNNFKKNLIRKASCLREALIDTAPAYSSAEYLIGKHSSKNLKVITKIAKLKKKTKDPLRFLLNKINKSLNKLKQKSIHGIMLHNSNDFIVNKRIFIKLIALLKIRKYAKKIGLSIYETEELYKIIKFWVPDFIQVPYNIFNREIESKKFLKLIAKHKIEIHVRSIFLKGLLSQKKTSLKKLSRWNEHFHKWFKWCEKNNIKPYEACYLFAKNNSVIKKIVVSFDNMKQFEEILKVRNRKLKFPDLRVKDKYFLNPSIW